MTTSASSTASSRPGRASTCRGGPRRALLVEGFGLHGFDYVGNSHADLDVWDKARKVYVADANRSLRREVGRRYAGCDVLSERENTLARYAKALRVHQWMKNILLFLPALAGHAFQPEVWGSLLPGFIAFSLCASSAYLLNDLLDLRNDRQHRSKRHRPFAAGTIPLAHGLVLAPVLLLAALALGALLGPAFLAMLGAYYALTLAYSLWLKRLAMLDVVALSGLYGIRMIAGSVVAGIPLSHWLAAFATFLFLFLALVKRATELAGQKTAGTPAGTSTVNGRGYAPDDLGIVEAMAAGAGFVSVMVFVLYISSDEVVRLYSHAERLWSGCLVMIYWVGHLLLLTHRGLMHDDPVVFALTDRNSLLCGLALRYATFCVAATLCNLGLQSAILRAGEGGTALAAALVCGTGAGLVVKYVLDKRWIYFDTSRGVAAHGRRFVLYTATGVVTTGIFWGAEYLFWRAADGRLWWVGAALGLTVGYVAKYRLDRRFVFGGG